MNKIILSGYIKNKQELIQGERVKHLWFDLAVKREYRKKSSNDNLQKYDLIPIHIFGNKAEALYLDKKNGDFLEIVGRLQYDWIKKEDGTIEQKVFVVPESVDYCS